ncbi:MAG TPA: hypothetical protein VIM16_14455 [Mucilaginibacter sp.]|jgi:adenine-specific DNA-methyltransferase
MAKKVDSIKHPSDKRAHIPSKEEAGYEDANAVVQKGKKVMELPKLQKNSLPRVDPVFYK